MTKTVTFEKESTLLTLPAPQQKHDAAGVELMFLGLTKEQKDAFAAFFKKTANGMRGLWTYVDSHGHSFPARFAESAMVFVKFEGAWDVSTRITKGPEAMMPWVMEGPEYHVRQGRGAEG